MEVRHFKPEIRAAEGQPEKGWGYFMVFNSETELWPGFREKIAPSALDEVMNDDVRVLVNHDSNLIVARTKAKTARLSKDEHGGIIEWEFPDTTAGRDLMENMRNGNIDGMSFGFTVKEDVLERDKITGETMRTITKLERLYDASPVVFPAYEQTMTELRSKLESRVEQENDEDRKKYQQQHDDDIAVAHEIREKRLKILSYM